MDSFHEVNKAHDMIKTSFTQFFGVEYPVIQGGMVWCSGWRLASAVSEAGGLGIIGSGSMYPDILREHIQKIRLATQKPFGVNVPLMYAHADQLIDVMIEEKIPVVITSAGSPSKYTSRFHEAGIKVIHVVSNLKFALKSQEAGVDAIVFEGFEAGGHNGNEETSTLVLMQLLRKHITIPLLAAGGIGSGEAILGLLAMGADGVQIGSLFAAAYESSAHDSFNCLLFCVNPNYNSDLASASNNMPKGFTNLQFRTVPISLCTYSQDIILAGNNVVFEPNLNGIVTVQ